MSTDLELEKLDYASLNRLLVEVTAQIEAKRENELKTLVNGWKMKAEQNGFSIAEVIAEFRTYMAAAAPKSKPSTEIGDSKPSARSADKEGQLPELGVTYKHPTTGDTWTKTGSRPKSSFVELIDQGLTWSELKLK